MEGVIEGVYYCNDDRVQELNQRISTRNIPSSALEPAYSIRPVSTKYAYLPILDVRKPSNVEMKKYEKYNSEKIFNPGNAQAPWNGYSLNVDGESKLRNQFFALQKCEQSNYVPSSKSDLYEVKVDGNNIDQNYPLLFDKQEFDAFNPNTCNLGSNLFDNCTRQQIKDT